MVSSYVYMYLKLIIVECTCGSSVNKLSALFYRSQISLSCFFLCSYAYLKISAKCLPRLGKTLIRRGTHPVFHSKTTPRPQWPPTPQPTYATTNQPSPPQPTMHPTLQQKLRLGSPTPHHKFSAINCKTTGRTSRTDLHEIPLASPFPKLPAHFSVRVASTGHRGWDNGDGDGEAAQSGTKKCTEQSKGGVLHDIRN